jgi:ribosome-associated protein
MLRGDDDRRRFEQRRLTGTASPSTARALVAAEAAAAKMGRDIVVLDVSASNTRQVRTIVDEVRDAMRASDSSKPLGVEGLEDASWVLLDYGDIVVHVFLDETRSYYDLDRLWADAGRIPFDEPQVAAGER